MPCALCLVVSVLPSRRLAELSGFNRWPGSLCYKDVTLNYHNAFSFLMLIGIDGVRGKVACEELASHFVMTRSTTNLSMLRKPEIFFFVIGRNWTLPLRLFRTNSPVEWVIIALDCFTLSPSNNWRLPYFRSIYLFVL